MKPPTPGRLLNAPSTPIYPTGSRLKKQLAGLAIILGATLCNGVDIAGSYVTHIAPGLAGFSLNSGTTITPAASGDGYTAIGNYTLDGNTMDFITKLRPNGSLLWSYQVDDPTGGAFVRHTPEDRIIVATYDSTTDTTEISQFRPAVADEAPTREYALSGMGNLRLSSALRYRDAGIYYFGNAGGKVQLAKYDATGALEMAKEYRVEKMPGLEAPASQARVHEIRDGFLLTFQSPGDSEVTESLHLARINRGDLSIEWLSSYLAETEALTVFHSSQVKVRKHMIFANDAGLDTANQFRVASLDLTDGSLNAGVVTGANRNPPAALFSDGKQALIMGNLDQQDGPGRFLTATSFDPPLMDFRGITIQVQNGWIHSFLSAGFSYPGRFNVEFQTQLSGLSFSQRWAGIFDLDTPENGQAWVNDFISTTRIGGYRFSAGFPPIVQFRDTAEQRLGLGLVNEHLGIGTERFEIAGTPFQFGELTIRFDPISLEPLEDREILVDDIHDTFDSPLSIKLAPAYNLSRFDVDVSYSNVGPEPEVTVNTVEYSETETARTLHTSVVASEPTTFLIGEKSRLDGRTRLVSQKTVIGDVPGLSHLFDFPGDRDTGFGLILVITPNLVAGETP